jgi:hypothetical protein
MTFGEKRLFLARIDKNSHIVELARFPPQKRANDVRAHLDETHFAWIGGTGPDAVFYYRVHSPVVLIEFDHQGPIALEGPPVASRRHVHTVVRTPNGNDYGTDLLRRHYQAHASDPAHGHRN